MREIRLVPFSVSILHLAGDFLILYTVQEKSVDLLSIKHHRQLSFNFTAHGR